MLFEKIKNWFTESIPSNHLVEFEIERLEFQTKAILLALKMGFVAVPIMTIADVFELHKIFSLFWWTWYVIILVVTELLILIIFLKIKQLDKIDSDKKNAHQSKLG